MPTMDESIRKAVETAIRETLEGMAFATVIADFGEEEDSAAETSGGCWCRIHVLQPRSGGLALQLPRSLAATLTSTMYGLLDEGELTSELLLDALRELANTFAGRFCASMCDDHSMFEVSLPEAGLDEDEDEDDSVPTHEHDAWPGARFQVDDMPLVIHVESRLMMKPSNHE